MKTCSKCKLERNESCFKRGTNICKECYKVKCEQCNKVFAHKPGLIRHIETVHEQKKPYKCDHWEYSCGQHSNLKSHMARCGSVIKSEIECQSIFEKELNSTYAMCPAGQIDILSNEELIEIKQWKYWKTALGQVFAYGFYYPTHKKRVHFYGVIPFEDTKNMIIEIFKNYNIQVTYEVTEKTGSFQ